jgi:uncharacterized protein (TIGR03792 family)|tara:strand:+ start:232 stop:675 length:444 start_codon:yes stop_codon:yes gene_type:complete
MKITLLKKNIKKFLYSCFFLVLLLSQGNDEIAMSLSMDNSKVEIVYEQLRLKIPSNYKSVWLEAEKDIWEPWLSKQDGFLGRQIFWDKENEEALILLKWKNKKLWKSIPMEEVNQIQRKFEENVLTYLNIYKNPFELIFEGELDKQK